MIVLENVDKAYDDHVLFHHFSQTFDEGKSYALIGPSGSGKSTLLNMIGKLEKVDGGSIYLNDQSLDKIKEKVYFKSYISYLFQNFGLIENQTIQENLELAFVGKKLPTRQRMERMKEALEKVNLQVELSRKIYSLSGGESQRVAIAKAILKDSPILLADEPTASLDRKNSLDIIDLILGFQDGKRIIIVATHDPMVYERMDHRILIGGGDTL